MVILNSISLDSYASRHLGIENRDLYSQRMKRLRVLSMKVPFVNVAFFKVGLHVILLLENLKLISQNYCKKFQKASESGSYWGTKGQ